MNAAFHFRFATFQEWLDLMQKMYYIVIIVFAVAIVLWILKNIGYMRMANKVSFPDPWLAWIPIINIYLFVRLAGEKNRKLGIAYLFTSFFGMLAAVIFFCAYNANNLTWTLAGSINGPTLFAMYSSMIIGCTLFFCVIIALAVMRFILLFSIFKRFKPEASVAFLVLSIFFKFLEPIFIFASSFGTPDAKKIPAEQDVPPPMQE